MLVILTALFMPSPAATVSAAPLPVARPSEPYAPRHLPKPVRDYSGLDLLNQQRVDGP
jgi:hypothetical protein